MGISYELVKSGAPEVFELGKGPWDMVFDRRYGRFTIIDKMPTHTAGNFLESFKIDPKRLQANMRKHLSYISEDSIPKLVTLIAKWAQDADLFLINYWEEIEYYPADKNRAGFEAEFSDLKDRCSTSLFDYKVTATIWD